MESTGCRPHRPRPWQDPSRDFTVQNLKTGPQGSSFLSDTPPPPPPPPPQEMLGRVSGSSPVSTPRLIAEERCHSQRTHTYTHPHTLGGATADGSHRQTQTPGRADTITDADRKGGGGQLSSRSGPRLEAECTQRTLANGESSLTFILDLK